jgi:hypothetical protein
MTKTVADTVRDGIDAFDSWYSPEGVEETHARAFVEMSYAMMAANAVALKDGTVTTDGELAVRWASAMFAAYQMGRASVTGEAHGQAV